MTKYNNPISIKYPNDTLLLLVEEYIIQQKADFTFEGVCSYILYWAMEEGKTANAGHAIYDNCQMNITDCDKVIGILDSIVKDGRLVKATDHYQLVSSKFSTLNYK